MSCGPCRLKSPLWRLFWVTVNMAILDLPHCSTSSTSREAAWKFVFMMSVLEDTEEQRSLENTTVVANYGILQLRKLMSGRRMAPPRPELVMESGLFNVSPLCWLLFLSKGLWLACGRGGSVSRQLCKKRSLASGTSSLPEGSLHFLHWAEF